ncbi:hypothetical protein ACFQY9_00920 [Microvirga aerilata]|uniref:hypothetical protein n=1 Tax=Microvirga aerilata TaxID=670292 RepID=UPI00363C3F77
MRVLVTRSPDAAARTARKLAVRGHEACLAPVTRIVPTGAPVPDGPYIALIVTSARSVEALARLPDRQRAVLPSASARPMRSGRQGFRMWRWRTGTRPPCRG